MPGPLGRKVQQGKAAMKGGGETEWNDKGGEMFRRDNCPGCGAKYSKMSRQTMNRHVAEARKNGLNSCPDD